MLWDNLRPEVRQRLTPYRATIEAAAARAGIQPDFVYATIAAESSGLAGATGDGGRAGGLYQVQHAFVRDYGMTDPAQRYDPVASTNAVVPKIAGMLRAGGGDWGAATAQYMRGIRHSQRLRAGESPEAVFAGDRVGLARYRQAVALQQKYGGVLGQSAVQPPAAGPAPMPMPAQELAAPPTALPPPVRSHVPFAMTPQPAPAPAPRGLPGFGAPRAQDTGVDDVMRMFGLDRLV